MKEIHSQRTCIGCGRKDRKDRLLRFSISAEGTLMLDIIQRLEGRGTYLCPQRRCFHQAIKRRRLLNRLSRDKIPDLREWIARVEEHLLYFIRETVESNETQRSNESDVVSRRKLQPMRHVEQALQNYVSLSSEGVANNDQD